MIFFCFLCVISIVSMLMEGKVYTSVHCFIFHLFFSLVLLFSPFFPIVLFSFFFLHSRSCCMTGIIIYYVSMLFLSLPASLVFSIDTSALYDDN